MQQFKALDRFLSAAFTMDGNGTIYPHGTVCIEADRIAAVVADPGEWQCSSVHETSILWSQRGQIAGLPPSGRSDTPRSLAHWAEVSKN